MEPCYAHHQAMTQTQHAPLSVEQQQSAARALLTELVAAQRSSIEANSTPAISARDLYKRVTGHSSLENAIEATRRAIEAYDRMLPRSTRASTTGRAGGPVGGSDNEEASPVGDSVRVPTIRVTSTGVPSVL